MRSEAIAGAVRRRASGVHTVDGGSASSRSADAFAGLVAGPLGSVGVLTLISSLGLLLVAVSFTLSRLDLPGAVPSFWIGVLVVATPRSSHCCPSGRRERSA